LAGRGGAARRSEAALMERLTLLHAHNERRLAKAFRVATNGQVAASNYDNAKYFAAETVPVEGIHDLHRLLCRIEGDPHACVIRGEAVAGTDLSRLRRAKAENGGPFAETPRRWAMLDIDGGVPLPHGCSVLADPTDAARAVLDILVAHAPELEGVTAVVQFSASAGLDELAAGELAAAQGTATPRDWSGVAKVGVRAHAWFWLATPRGEAELKRWIDGLAEVGLTLDRATVQTVQPHYTAAPVFGMPLRDPLAGRRTVLVEGVDDAAELAIPDPAVASTAGAARTSAHAGRGYRGHLDTIGPEGFHTPVLRAASAYVASNWPDPDLAALKADLRARVRAADPGGRSAAEITDRASDRHLDGAIAWVMGQERRKRETQAAQAAAAEAVPPTFPDRGVPLGVAKAQAKAAVEDFATRVAAGECPTTLLRMTVGAGKSEAAIVNTGKPARRSPRLGQGGRTHLSRPPPRPRRRADGATARGAPRQDGRRREGHRLGEPGGPLRRHVPRPGTLAGGQGRKPAGVRRLRRLPVQRRVRLHAAAAGSEGCRRGGAGAQPRLPSEAGIRAGGGRRGDR
jgi:hypothetical protein